MNEEFIPLRNSVQWFAREMERQLFENDHKGGWGDMRARRLLTLLKKETVELERAVAAGKGVIEEAADVANFAMMIAENFDAMPAPEEF